MSKVSATLNCQNIVAERKKSGLHIYNFGLGDNPLRQSTFFTESLRKHAEQKDYTSSQGIDVLKTAIKKIFSTPEYIVHGTVIGNGLKELIFIMQLSFEGMIFHITPSWVSYREQLKILNKMDKLVEIPTLLEDNYKLSPEVLNNVLQIYKNEPKMLIFNNPHNPTGIHYTPQEIKNLATVLNNNNCIVLADEIYLNLVHSEESCTESISKYIPHLTVRGSSVSKDMGCGGYRSGWLTYPKELDSLFRVCASNASTIYSSSVTPIQYATADILNNVDIFNRHCTMTNNIFKNIVNDVMDILDPTKLEYVRPTSAWYIFINFENCVEFLNKYKITDSEELMTLLVNTLGIVTVPGNSFNDTGINLRFALVDIDNNAIESNYNADCYRNITDGFKKLVEFIESV
jgi:aspartate aminotransferase